MNFSKFIGTAFWQIQPQFFDSLSFFKPDIFILPIIHSPQIETLDNLR